MRRTYLQATIIISAMVIMLTSACSSTKRSIDPVAALYADREIQANIRYSKADSSLLLDAYIPSKKLGEPPWQEYSADKKPVLVYFHGGGWSSGDKVDRSLFLMPYVSRGWVVITINYRLLGKTNLAGIIDDCQTAMGWVYDNADKYKIDVNKIIVSGESAGGYNALMMGLLPGKSPAGKITRQVKVAGIVNFFGATSLGEILKGQDPNAVKFMMGSAANLDSLEHAYSPMAYVTAGSPPVITIHGDQDPVVPYGQAVMLQQQLNKVNVKNYLYTVKGKKHGNFDGQEMTASFDHIWKFLDDIGVNSPLPRIQ